MTDLFAAQTDAAQIDANRNYLEDLVGDGKKFKSPEELARGKAEADLFIERLKKEMEGLRNELNTKATLEEYIDKMSHSKADTNSSQTNTNVGDDGRKPDQTLSPDDVRKAIREEIEAESRQRVQSQNLQEVKNELQKVYGNDYVNKLRETATSLGVTEEYLNRMARETPKALLKLVGTEVKTPASNGLFTPPQSQLQTGFVPQNTDRNHSYYEKLRKTDSKEYWTPKIQNQMHQDAMRLGDRFFT